MTFTVPPSVRRVFREPLAHFLLLGGAVFAVYGLGQPQEVQETWANKVEITEGQIEQAILRFESTWRRQPEAGEMDALINAMVREDILVQEALKLGMDQGDAVIRRRLVQKMDFLLTSAASATPPDETELKAFYTDTEANYTTPARVAFEHVFLGERPDKTKITATLEVLEQGFDPKTIGERTLLPTQLPMAEATQIDALFGTGFTEVLSGVDVGLWTAPVRSAYGVHAVRINSRAEPAIQPFDSVRDLVLAEWLRVRSQELTEEMYNELQGQYEIVRPDVESLMVQGSQ